MATSVYKDMGRKTLFDFKQQDQAEQRPSSQGPNVFLDDDSA